jgi:hypothetical protein
LLYLPSIAAALGFDSAMPLTNNPETTGHIRLLPALLSGTARIRFPQVRTFDDIHFDQGAKMTSIRTAITL